jgi:vacuolar-type H+-ATPase subunit I/STV1
MHLEVAQHVAVIRTLGKRVLRDFIEIGGRLKRCKEGYDVQGKKLVEHGEWLPLLKQEFGWSERTARDYMDAYEFAQQNFKSAATADLNIGLNSICLLARPDTPEEAIDTVLSRAADGEVLSRKQVREIVDSAVEEATKRQLQAARDEADRRERAVRDEYEGKLIIDPADLQAKIEKAVAPLQRRIENYETKLEKIRKQEQERIRQEHANAKKASAPSKDFLSPPEADKALSLTAGYLKTTSLDPPPGIRACLKEAMLRASADDIRIIAAATVFLRELMECAK